LVYLEPGPPVRVRFPFAEQSPDGLIRRRLGLDMPPLPRRGPAC